MILSCSQRLDCKLDFCTFFCSLVIWQIGSEMSNIFRGPLSKLHLKNNPWYSEIAKKAGGKAAAQAKLNLYHSSLSSSSYFTTLPRFHRERHPMYNPCLWHYFGPLKQPTFVVPTRTHSTPSPQLKSPSSTISLSQFSPSWNVIHKTLHCLDSVSVVCM